MADTILLKRNATAGVIPAAGALTAGQLALNTGDCRLWTLAPGSVVAQVGERIVRQLLSVDNAAIASTSLTSVANLGLTIAASETWALSWMLAIVLSSTTGTFGASVVGPAGATGSYVVQGMNGAPGAGAATVKHATNAIGTAVGSGVFGATGSTSALTYLAVSATVKNSSTAGTVNLQLNGSLSTFNIVVKALSLLEASRLA